MHLVSSLKIVQAIPRCCCSNLLATNRNALHVSKQIFNFTAIQKTIATSAVVKDRWDNPTIEYFENKPVKKENVDRIIYEFKAKIFLKLSNLLFYGTACFGLYIAPDILLGTLEHTAFNLESFSNIAGITISTMLIPLGSRMFTKRIVLKLYHNAAKDTYVAHVYSPFLFEKKLHFHQTDLEPSKKNLLYNLTTVRAKKYPMFLQSDSFVLPSDYNHLMGFDK